MSIMNYSTLKEEVANDPLARGYAAMTDAQIAESMNTEGRQKSVSVHASAIIDKLVEFDALVPIQLSASAAQADYTNATDAQKAALKSAGTLRAYSDHGGGEVDFSLPHHAAIMADLVTHGFLSQAQSDEITGMGETIQSRAAELGLGSVYARDVAKARTL